MSVRSNTRLRSVALLVLAPVLAVAAPWGGLASAAGGTITSVSPNTAVQTRTVTVTLSGYSTVLAPNAAAMAQGSVTITGSIVSATPTQTVASFDLNGAGSATGAYDIHLTNTGNPLIKASCTGCFTITPSPTVTSLSPVGVVDNGAQTVTATGTHFVAGATVALVRPGQTSIPGTSVSVTATTVTATFDVTGAAPTGPTSAPADHWTLTVTNPDTGSAGHELTVVSAGPPTVTAVTPTTRPQGATAAPLTIDGTNLAKGASVTFGTPGVTAVPGSVTWVSLTELTVNVTVTGTATLGPTSVTVTNTDGHAGACASGCFAVSARPTLTATPLVRIGQGAVAHVLTFTGTGFAPGATVGFSGTGLTPGAVTVASPTSLSLPVTATATAPLTARDVTVTNPDGGAVTQTGLLVVDAAPTLTSATPATRGQGAASTTVQVIGTGFVSGLTVAVSGTGVTLANVVFTDDKNFTVDVTVAPTAAAGPRTLTVTNPDGGVGAAAVLSIGAAPTVTSLTPATGGQGAAHRSVGVAGSGYAAGAVATISGTGVTVLSTTVNSPTQLTLDVAIDPAASVGARDLTITNSGGDGGVVTTPGAFTVDVAPSATSASPAGVGRGAVAHLVTVTGTGFDLAGATVTFSGTGVTASAVNVVSATSLQVNVTVDPSATLGLRSITVTNADGGTGTTAGILSVTSPPMLSTITPSAMKQGSSGDVTVTGTGFVTGLVLDLGPNVVVTLLSVTSPTTATAHLSVDPTASLGARSGTVTNPDGGQSTTTGVLSIQSSPTVTSAGPPVVTGEVSTVTIHGSSFDGIPAVTFAGGLVATAVSRIDTQTLQVSVSVPTTTSAGAYSVTVTNGDGGSATCVNCMGVLNRTTLTLYPTAATIIAGQTVRLSGRLTRTYVGNAIPGGEIRLYQRVYPGTTYSQVAAAIRTQPDGTWFYFVHPAVITRYIVRYVPTGLDAGVMTNNIPITVKVAVTVLSPASGTTVARGTLLTVRAGTSPAKPGNRATLVLRRSDGKLIPIAAATIGSDGTVTLQVRAGTAGTYTLAVEVAGSASNAAGMSGFFTVTVT